MPKISNKGRNIPSSPIRKLVPYSDIAKKKGIDVLHLNIGQPDIESPIESIKGIKENELKLQTETGELGSGNWDWGSSSLSGSWLLRF